MFALNLHLTERRHRSITVIVNFVHITPSSSVPTVDLEHVFIFRVFLNFNRF